MTITWHRPGQCLTWMSWLFHSWDMASHHYTREHGVRVLGVELVWFYKGE